MVLRDLYIFISLIHHSSPSTGRGRGQQRKEQEARYPQMELVFGTRSKAHILSSRQLHLNLPLLNLRNKGVRSDCILSLTLCRSWNLSLTLHFHGFPLHWGLWGLVPPERVLTQSRLSSLSSLAGIGSFFFFVPSAFLILPRFILGFWTGWRIFADYGKNMFKMQT